MAQPKHPFANPTPTEWFGTAPSTPYPCKAKHLQKVIPGRNGGRAIKCATPEKAHPREGQLWLGPQPGHAMRKSIARSRLSYQARRGTGAKAPVSASSAGRTRARGVTDRLAPNIAALVFGTTRTAPVRPAAAARAKVRPTTGRATERVRAAPAAASPPPPRPAARRAAPASAPDVRAHVFGVDAKAKARPARPAAAPPTGRSVQVDPEVLAVLKASTIRGNELYLPSQLDPKFYRRVGKVIEALGGKWHSKSRAHLFPRNPTKAIAALVATGRLVRPTDIGWYPTPPALAARIVADLNVREGELALEPSAGEGAIAEALRSAGADVRCIEIDEGRAQTLRAKGFKVLQKDFLTWTPVNLVFDVVVMNPPFGRREDIWHVTHALRMLRRGGRLAAIMSSGVEWRQDRQAEQFRALVRAQQGTITALPENTFRASGTSVRTVLVTMTR